MSQLGLMNRGGFSWRRFMGVSAAKSRLSRAIGVPLSRSGRQQKIGRIVTGQGGGLIVLLMLPFLIVVSILGLFIGGGKSKSGNIGCLLILGGLLIFCAGIGNNFTHSEGVNSVVAAPTPTRNKITPRQESPFGKLEKKSTNLVVTPAGISTEPSKQTELKPSATGASYRTLESMEGMTLPITITTTSEVVLRDKSGKEVILPTGTSIKVSTRSEHGTLSMDINGALFVGNESRITGKAEIEN
jgi:hypothetical protein